MPDGAFVSHYHHNNIGVNDGGHGNEQTKQKVTATVANYCAPGPITLPTDNEKQVDTEGDKTKTDNHTESIPLLGQRNASRSRSRQPTSGSVRPSGKRRPVHVPPGCELESTGFLLQDSNQQPGVLPHSQVDEGDDEASSSQGKISSNRLCYVTPQLWSSMQWRAGVSGVGQERTVMHCSGCRHHCAADALYA